MYIAIAFMNIRIGLIFLEESNCRNDCPVSSGHVIQVFVSYNHSVEPPPSRLIAPTQPNPFIICASSVKVAPPLAVIRPSHMNMTTFHLHDNRLLYGPGLHSLRKCHTE